MNTVNKKGELNMKGLSEFLKFASAEFFEDKRLQATSCGPLLDYTTKKPIGTKVGIVIIEDRTTYHSKSGEQFNNQFERFNVKVLNKELNLTPGEKVTLVNPKCVVYGNYRNQLSVTCDDVQPVQHAGKP